MRVKVAVLLMPTLLGWVATPALARVVLIGVDGGSWNAIDPMLEAGELPHLKALQARGVTANLEAVEPMNSPTVWTSIATGRRPESHGVTSFFATRLSVRVPTVWERLAAAGLRIGLYDYLVTWPPPSFPGGFAIPGWLRRDDAVAPPDLFEKAGVRPFAYSVKDVWTPGDHIANTRDEVAVKPKRWNRLAEKFELDAGAVVFYSVDVVSHRFWHAAFPEDYEDGAPRAEPGHRSVVPDTLRGIDRAIGEIGDALGPDDSVVIVSDHGFQADEAGSRRIWAMRPESSIEAAGFDPERDGFSIVGGWGRITIRVHKGPLHERDAVLERLIELFEAARGEDDQPLFDPIFLDTVERPSDAQRPIGQRLRQLAVRAFLWWYDVELSEPAHAYLFIRPRAEAVEGIWPEGTVRIGAQEIPAREFFSPNDFSGTHRRDGIILAAGGPIRAQAERGRISVLDVAPLLFYLVGRAIPDDLEGNLPTSWIEPAHLAANPPAQVSAKTLPEIPRGRAGSPSKDPRVMERLRSLGYVE